MDQASCFDLPSTCGAEGCAGTWPSAGIVARTTLSLWRPANSTGACRAHGHVRESCCARLLRCVPFRREKPLRQPPCTARRPATDNSAFGVAAPPTWRRPRCLRRVPFHERDASPLLLLKGFFQHMCTETKMSGSRWAVVGGRCCPHTGRGVLRNAPTPMSSIRRTTSASVLLQELALAPH